MTRLIVLLFLLCGATAPALAQSVERYYVSGRNTAELYNSIKRLGPYNAFGYTEFKWSYSYRSVRSNGVSRIIDAEAEQKLTFRMPYWKGYPRASRCLQQSWTAMYASLSRHEIKHAMLGQNVAAEIEQALLAVPPQRTNFLLKQAVKRAADAVIEANARVQRKFDEDTAHGAKDPTDPIRFAHCP